MPRRTNPEQYREELRLKRWRKKAQPDHQEERIKKESAPKRPPAISRRRRARAADMELIVG